MINPLQAILQHIQGGGGAPQPPQQPQAPEGDGTQGVKPLISQMIQLGVQAMQAEKDPVERAALSKIVSQLHQFEATEQKQRDAAMGAGPAVQMLRRSQG